MRSVRLVSLLLLLAAGASMSADMKPAISITPATLPRIATVDERYQSYNVEIAEVIGGKFWKPYDNGRHATDVPKPKQPEAAASGNTSPTQVGTNPSMFQARPPIDLTDARLRKLASALGPAYVRVSGSWANSMYFHDEDTPAPSTAAKGFDGVLTRRQWHGAIDFARAVNARLVTSFAISAGVRDAAGVWTPVQARKLIRYTHDIGGHIDAAEMFNEPDMPTYAGAPAGYSAENYARDFAVFAPFIRSAAPDMRIVGPGAVIEGMLGPELATTAMTGFIHTEAMMTAAPRPVFDVFSYHFYPAASIRCAGMGVEAQTTPEAAMSEEWLARTDRSYGFYVTGIRDRFQPGSAVWITETAESACGGNPWAKTFLDTFRYVDQMGRLARRGVKVIFHNTLASSEYGLLDQNTFRPRPNYWAALLWRRLMGTTVLDAGPSHSGLHRYAHCLRGQPGGVALLLINNSRTAQSSVAVPTASERYTLSANVVESEQILLNGTALRLGADDELPDLSGTPTPGGRVTLPPATITFLAVPTAGNVACR